MNNLDQFIEEAPNGLARMFYERFFFPVVDYPYDPATGQEVNTRDYFFYGFKSLQIKITDFLRGEILKLYPIAKDY